MDSRGDTPDVPLRGTTRGSPRQRGCVGGGDAVAATERVRVALRVPVDVSESVGVAVELLEPVSVELDEGVSD